MIGKILACPVCGRLMCWIMGEWECPHCGRRFSDGDLQKREEREK